MTPFRQTALTAAMLAVMVMTFTTVAAKNDIAAKAYMFGFVASFNDSTVYFTDIQELDSVWFSEKKNLLLGRSNYSYQLRDYFANKLDMPKRTCVVIANMKRKTIEKKYEKMKKMYTSPKKGKPYDVRYLSSSDFTFTAVDMDNSTDEPVVKEKKKKEKKPKQGKPDGKRPPRDGKMPPSPKKDAPQ